MEDKVEEVLDGGDLPPLGRYRLDLATETWSWSSEVYRMHGFEPGQVVPTTALMLAHKHPDDLGATDGVLKQAAESGRAFSSVHRVLDAQGGTRTLVITGEASRDPDTGEVAELSGYFIDVTGSHRAAAARDASVSIQASSERRAVIDQAKGILMMTYSLEHTSAFELLRRVSNETNVPVRDIAGSLVDLASSSVLVNVAERSVVDEFLRSLSSAGRD
ncbi:PAS and ANTAR domain-containing protein [Promicromonospora kroppenstedtii]|uniref:PAS and ANTAR domain-containing protein n=1 Tax=Promicromonospora kroppenstedtii TaxID=440482 RepID=UPI0004B7E86C|nr:PAS and ANTAR domain-containing protein [Promicromonospora kroppenstedtii]